LVARHEKQVPFDYAQGRLSAPLKYASLQGDRFVFDMNIGEKDLGIRFALVCYVE
jgi:hypothetical protein